MTRVAVDGPEEFFDWLDVFHNSVGTRADAGIQRWLNETQEREHD
jgi:hypothetical protein